MSVRVNRISTKTSLIKFQPFFTAFSVYFKFNWLKGKKRRIKRLENLNGDKWQRILVDKIGSKRLIHLVDNPKRIGAVHLHLSMDPWPLISLSNTLERISRNSDWIHVNKYAGPRSDSVIVYQRIFPLIQVVFTKIQRNELSGSFRSTLVKLGWTITKKKQKEFWMRNR